MSSMKTKSPSGMVSLSSLVVSDVEIINAPLFVCQCFILLVYLVYITKLNIPQKNTFVPIINVVKKNCICFLFIFILVGFFFLLFCLRDEN